METNRHDFFKNRGWTQTFGGRRQVITRCGVDTHLVASLRRWTQSNLFELMAHCGGGKLVQKDGRVVFNIAGNKYRVVAWINYPHRVVYIRFIGTHSQYDRRRAVNLGAVMEIKPIRTKRDYESALKAVEKLMTAKRGTLEGDRLDVLVTLIEAYEARNFPMDLPDPVAAIKFVMEQRSLTAKVGRRAT